ncbi:MAG: isoleucine--tRNA ligase, partial [Methanomassiliicoccales archaeon]
MIRQVQSGYTPSEIEEKVRQYWTKNNIYRKVKESRSSFPDFYFVDGPPYTTGHIHLGTALNKILKDAILRYKRMSRNNVRDQPGFDMHGLPIEVKVEKSIGVRSKTEIEEYGIDKFVGTCRDYALDFQSKMTEQFKELGVWMDWDQPYMTINPSYIEAAWWTLRRAFDRDLLTSDERVLSWCPRCETALAEAEIEYWEERDPSIYVKFPLKDQDASLLIWTTTPWTLPANMAVAVHPQFDYSRVRFLTQEEESGEIIILSDLVDPIGEMMGWEEYEILEEMKGEELVGLEYLPPLEEEVPYQSKASGEWVHRVIPSDTVEAENTGLVHIAPGHGPEDFELGRRFDIEPFCPVDGSGRFTMEAGDYQGTFVKKANQAIMEDLDRKGVLFHRTEVTHRYGHCWRCESSVIYRATTQWFLRVTRIRDLMLSEVERVRWIPDWAGSSRQYDWVQNARDWCISRQRYWGIPLPVWTCECGEIRVVSSLSELEGGEGYREDMDPHRPWIDEVSFTCDKCGGKMGRVPDVLDVWFDAGVTSWAQLGFPHTTEKFERWWPSKFITEAHDQTRGWFYSQLASSCIAFDRSPYESVLMHGWVLDPKGQPMSKSKGNVIEPIKVMEEYGADALRFYMLKANAPWEDMAFQYDGVKNARKTLNILWNVLKFSTTYMSLDEFSPGSVDHSRLSSALRREDQWMISRTERIKNEMTRYLNSMEMQKACRVLEDFIVEDLSRLYVRLIRDRMWKEEGDVDKLAAYRVLYDSLMTAARLMAPLCPFMAEEVYDTLDGEMESVHMLDWPTPDLTRVNERLESTMDLIQELVDIVVRERQKVGLKLRWPLKRVVIKTKNEEMMKSLKSLEHVLKSQANIKEVEYVPPGEEWGEMVLSVIPNPNAIGKVYRQWASKIAVLLKSRDPYHIKERIDKGQYSLGIEGQMVKIEPNMVSFSRSLPQDVVDQDFSEGKLYLDFELTRDIEAEGFARELIRRIQQMRKEMKLDVEEYVHTEVQAPSRLTEYFKDWKDYIMNETRSRRLLFTEKPEGEYRADWSIDDEEIIIVISSLNVKDSLERLMVIPGLSQESALALVEAGITSLEELQNRDEEYLEEIKGLSKGEVRRIIHYLEERGGHVGIRCPSCRALVDPEAETCPHCGTDLTEGALDKDDLVKKLSPLGVDEEMAEALYQAGYDSRAKLEGATVNDLRDSGLGDLAESIVEHLHSPEEQESAPEEGGLELESGSTYLIKEERAHRSYELFERALKEGNRGFCVTRNYPLKIKSRFDLGETPMIWLSSIGRENSLRPKDLEKLSFSLDQFINNEGGVLLLDGLEYLITNNNFLTVLRLSL